MQFASFACYERARLVFRYYTHDSGGRHHVAADTVVMRPGDFAEQNPSLTLHVDDTAIEYYYARARGGAASAPTVLLIHGDQSDARDLLPLAQAVTLAGYNAMALSQPGYGASGGSPDLCGPATMHAVEAALATLRRSRGVDSTRIAVWGIERGGTLAAWLALTHPELAGAIATRGLFDLPALARISKPYHDALVAEAGRDSAAWRSRSPAALPPHLTAPLLLESTETDPLVPAAQSGSFAAALQTAGQPVESQHLEGAERPLPVGPARDEGFAFLARIFKRP
jgi:dipeptidyl aminopeptidase/acylaminoacyl peptidase